MPDAAFDALKHACLHQITWLLAQAEEFERSNCQHLETTNGESRDKSPQTAEEFRHQANNLQAVSNAYERLWSKAIQDPF